MTKKVKNNSKWMEKISNHDKNDGNEKIRKGYKWGDYILEDDA